MEKIKDIKWGINHKVLFFLVIIPLYLRVIVVSFQSQIVLGKEIELIKKEMINDSITLEKNKEIINSYYEGIYQKELVRSLNSTNR